MQLWNYVYNALIQKKKTPVLLWSSHTHIVTCTYIYKYVYVCIHMKYECVYILSILDCAFALQHEIEMNRKNFSF